ncbi:MAG: hypothetical protein PHQ96_08440, partial [Candidatus Omnitrophica bacterium]|nr:hypothetical protein [Candidatus Omnitrophota bacterium]
MAFQLRVLKDSPSVDMAKRVLCITQLFPPYPETRAIQIYRLLSKIYENGFYPVIYTQKPYNYSQRLDYSIIDKEKDCKYDIHSSYGLWRSMIVRVILQRCKILRVPDLFSNGRWSFLSWNINTCLKILFSRKNKFDLIFTVSTPVADHVSGLILKKVLNLPWVVFFSDAWVDNSS